MTFPSGVASELTDLAVPITGVASDDKTGEFKSDCNGEFSATSKSSNRISARETWEADYKCS